MNEMEKITFISHYNEVIALIRKWQDDGASTPEIFGIISTVQKSVEYSYGAYLREAMSKMKETP